MGKRKYGGKGGFSVRKGKGESRKVAITPGEGDRTNRSEVSLLGEKKK